MVIFIPLFNFNTHIYMVLINFNRTKLKEGGAEIPPIKHVTIKKTKK